MALGYRARVMSITRTNRITVMNATDPGLDFFGRPLASHVPPELVRRVDIFDGPGLDTDPFTVIRQLRDEPPLIYNMHNPFKGQSWIPTRAELIRAVAGNPALFSSVDQLGFSAMIGETWKYGPLEMDPPQHTQFRRLINQWLSPAAVTRLTDKVRARAIELIDRIAQSNGCEFVTAFGTPYPVSIFTEMMGLPSAQTPEFLRWVSDLLHTGDFEIRKQAVISITGYLRTLIADRRRQPTTDVASSAVAAEIDGKPLTDDELLGLCYLLFTGGLDTVAASLGFFFRHLAMNPEHQEWLRKSPKDIPNAIDELLRCYTPTQALRQALADTEIAGIPIRKGDWVNIILSLGSLDPREFENPDVVDFERKNIRHLAFSYGPHHCAGNHLARRELAIALEEWTQRIPTFRLVKGTTPRSHGGQVFGVDRLEIEWQGRT